MFRQNPLIIKQPIFLIENCVSSEKMTFYTFFLRMYISLTIITL